jgi:hypothetical protein
MPFKIQNHSSIAEDLAKLLKKIGLFFLVSICEITKDMAESLEKIGLSFLISISMGFLLVSLICFKKNFLHNDYVELINTLQEHLALNSICLLFLFDFLMWGIYLLFICFNPAIYYASKSKDWMLQISSFFVQFSSVSFGVIFSARISLRILSVFGVRGIKEIIEIGNLNHEFIIIYLWFLIFVPYYCVLKPIAESKKHPGSAAITCNRLRKFKNRCILFFFGGIFVCISVFTLLFFLVLN